MSNLESVRQQLEALDKEIIGLLEARYHLVAQIKSLKEQAHTPKLQLDEFKRKLDVLKAEVDKGAISTEDVEALYTQLHELAIKWQS